MTSELIKIDQGLLDGIQAIINECMPIASTTAQSISDSLVIANGLNQMREFFKNDNVEKLVLSMKDSKLGFLTDRSPSAIKKHNSNSKKRYELKPYSYDEITEALLPLLLEGYRFTGNEINVLSYQGMAVKAGKHRRIIEYKGIEGFIHTVGTPQKEEGDSGIAKMKCQARWIISAKEYMIGYGDDLCIVPVEYDKWSGLDKLIGQAESKLYSRVLTRILGKFVPEGEVVIVSGDSKSDNVGSEQSESDKLKDKFKSPQEGEKHKKDSSSKESSQVEGREEMKEKSPGSWVKELSKLIEKTEYQSVIQSLLKSKDLFPEDLRTERETKAEYVFELLEKVKGFETTEKKDLDAQHQEPDYFGGR